MSTGAAEDSLATLFGTPYSATPLLEGTVIELPANTPVLAASGFSKAQLQSMDLRSDLRPKLTREELLRPGPYASEEGFVQVDPVVDRTRSFSAFAEDLAADLGLEFGCHTCGTRIFGPQGVILDHMPLLGGVRGYPQCEYCSSQQGGFSRPNGFRSYVLKGLSGDLSRVERLPLLDPHFTPIPLLPPEPGPVVIRPPEFSKVGCNMIDLGPVGGTAVNGLGIIGMFTTAWSFYAEPHCGACGANLNMYDCPQTHFDMCPYRPRSD